MIALAANGQEVKLGKRQRAARFVDRVGLLGLLSGARSLLVRDLRILAYHRVLPRAQLEEHAFDPDLISASADVFREQMRYIARHFRPLTFRELADRIERGLPVERGSVIVTFDDGYEDNYTIAFPILREVGVPATFFLATGHVDRGTPYRYDWFAHALLCGRGRIAAAEIGIEREMPGGSAERQALVATALNRLKALTQARQDALIDRVCADLALPIPAADARCRPMQWAQAREMARAGMEFGSHGVTHRMLAKLSDAEIAAEVLESKAAIERETGATVTVISYPVGGTDAFDQRVIDASRAAGYRFACSYLSGTNRAGAWQQYALRRLKVERYTDAVAFRSQLALPEVFSYRSPERRAVGD